jgi:phage tail-like protein
MNAKDPPKFLYLNRDNRWLDFKWAGLELAVDGTLRLAALPRLEALMPQEVAALPTPTGPSGLAVGNDGTIYFSDPTGHRLRRLDACDGRVAPVDCVGGAGSLPSQLREPRGLWLHPIRQVLLVADSGNHRIQLFDPSSWQLVGIWGQPYAAGEPQPSSDPGRFNQPWSIAGDVAGSAYVVDHGNGRVQKFDLLGNVVPTFAETLRAQGVTEPSAVAVSMVGPSTEIYVLDAGARTVFVLDPDGGLLRSFALQIESQQPLDQPIGLAVTSDALYVGDNLRRRVLKFMRDGALVGAALGYEGPVAALAMTADEGLLVHPGGDLTPLRLALKGGYVKDGVLWGGPFNNPSARREQWHRLKAMIAPLPAEAHLQLYVYSATRSASPPVPSSAATSFAVPPWSQLPLDIAESLFPGAALDHVWIGVEFSGEGLTSPALTQMRVDFAHQTYLQYLPSIYRDEPQSRHFLDRFLALFESLLSEAETAIADLPRLFDPAAAPREVLAWLGGWLALDLNDAWDEAQQRQLIADAFEIYARRGTVEGLRLAVRRFAGVEVGIEEPILQTGWWSLAGDATSPPLEAATSILGFTTMLAPAEAQGAVVGTTAVLDRSHLISQEEFGLPLFTDVAHQFAVQLYQGRSYSEQKRDDVRALLDREKPAHTTYHLCIIEPRMRVGFQARLGIDSIVAGPPPPTPLGQPPVVGADFVLGGHLSGRIGERSRIGQTTRLGEGSVDA